MRKLFPWLALLLASCVPMQPLGRSTLVVRPEFARTTQTTINPYTQTDINHLTLKLFTTAGQDLGISKDLLNAQLGNAIAFSNLKNNTNYRIRAYAYLTAGTGSCISTNDSSSYTDVLVGTDDRPTLATLSVKLIDRDFNGQGTGSLAITPGGYIDPGASSMDYYTVQGVVKTIAGNGATGSVNASGTAASFNYPVGVAVDATGNVYVADRSNQMIRKITPAGVVSTLAGNGVAAVLDGTGTAAEFNNPHGVAVDAAGNVYVAETSGFIRKITPEGVVTTIAGNGGSSFVDGQGTAATFSGPYGIACDKSGNLYVADGFGHRIRKISSTGMVSTLAGNGASGFANGNGTNAIFNCPVGIAVDANGNVFVGEYSGYRVRKITSSGDVTTVAGNGLSTFQEGVGTAASIVPWGVAVDNWGYLYVADRSNKRVCRITPSGVVTSLAGGVGTALSDGTGVLASIRQPLGITSDGTGNLYFADHSNHAIRKIQ